MAVVVMPVAKGMTMRINPPSKVGQRVQFGQYTGTVLEINGFMATIEVDRVGAIQEVELVDLEVIV